MRVSSIEFPYKNTVVTGGWVCSEQQNYFGDQQKQTLPWLDGRRTDSHSLDCTHQISSTENVNFCSHFSFLRVYMIKFQCLFIQ